MPLTGHVDIVTDQDNKVWTYKVPTKFQQTSLITIDIVFGNGAIVLPPRFPLPAFKQGSQTRIPRKPSYVEIIVPVTNPLHAEPLSDFIYPVILGPDSLPTVLNGWHQNLSALITLDVEEREKRAGPMGISSLGMTANQQLDMKESIFTIFMLSSNLHGGQTGVFMLQHPDLGCVINLAPTLDMVKAGELTYFPLVLRKLDFCALNINDEELRVWRCLIPAFIERCRTWSHKAKCEYKKIGATIPLSQITGEQFILYLRKCKATGRPPAPARLGRGAKYMVRGASNLTFSVPFVEGIMDTSALGKDSKLEYLMLRDRCRSCGRKEGANGKGLKACSRRKGRFVLLRGLQED
ncbi:hypothetical protein BKA67DRAFT_659868 [Truncatella angustata]|uniref:Uncharacterized protein n=1 Tax=Truncatella angustata TaxID=152316 RepID=A0A9P8UJG9_9PEZI|nr:uncharacterized protein BKA67DRAFT_659868 [Truncatella angustata]KAH6653234.1 hypothetical protein BKA67DRAFT_659868 [Truncatella angustata]